MHHSDRMHRSNRQLHRPRRLARRYRGGGGAARSGTARHRDLARLPCLSCPWDEALPPWCLVPPARDAGLRMVRYLGERAEDHDCTATATRQPKQLDAGILQAEISSFALHLAAWNKSAKTIRTYTEAVQRFAAAHLLQRDSRDTWEQVDSHDIQQWMSWLLDRYSGTYASNQYRALQQFFKWLAAEDELPDPDGRAAAPAGPAAADPGLHRPGADPAGTRVRRSQLRPTPRHRDHRGVQGDRQPAVRAGRPAVQPR